jgi:acyl-CoA dehydrogenase
MNPTSVESLLVESVDRILRQACTLEVVERAEADRWCPSAWEPLAQAGFPWIDVPEGAGGSGGTLTDAMAVVHAVGRHAAPVPLAETGVLAGWLSAEAGFPIPDGPCSVVPDPAAVRVDGDRVVGEAVVAWGVRADRILALIDGPEGWLIASIEPGRLEVTPGANLAGEPRDTVRFDVALRDVDHTLAPDGVDGEALRRRGALTRIVLSAGALETISQMTVDYTSQRRQFGRPISAFQAVQQHLVTAAQAVVRATMASDLAVHAVSGGGGRFEVAAARVIVDSAAVEATRSAHQAHGAMGVTREYPLHLYSRWLLAWRHEYGRARAWRRQLGVDVAAAGADTFFPTVTQTAPLRKD